MIFRPVSHSHRRTADNKLAGRVNVKLVFWAHPAFGQGGEDVRSHQLADFILIYAFVVLVERRHEVAATGLPFS